LKSSFGPHIAFVHNQHYKANTVVLMPHFIYPDLIIVYQRISNQKFVLHD